MQGEGISEAVLNTGKCNLMNTVLGRCREKSSIYKKCGREPDWEQDEDIARSNIEALE